MEFSSIAGAIRDYLRKERITQRDLSERLGWSEQKTSRTLRNQQGLSAEHMADICEALHVPYDYFIIRTRGGESS